MTKSLDALKERLRQPTSNPALKVARVPYFVARRAKRWGKRTARRLIPARPPRFRSEAWRQPIRIALYANANLNVIDGSSVWTQSTAEALAADPRVGVIMPLRTADRRDVITRPLRADPHIELVDTRWIRRAENFLTIDQVIDALDWIDRRRPFDALVVRGYDLCNTAVRRGLFANRLWAAYILEPELDIDDAYVAGMTAIANHARYVVVQTDGMRRLLEQHVPAAAGKCILIPPAIAPVTGPLAPGARRIFYTGKFAPHYPFLELVGIFTELRAQITDLEFVVAGDKIFRPPGDDTYPRAVESALTETPGLTWLGGIAREEVVQMLSRGGIGLNVWDPAYANTMNDLVIPSKTLDYCAAGIPVIAQRTSMHAELLGADYPLLVGGTPEVADAVKRLLKDDALYDDLAARCRAVAQRFTYEAVAGSLRAQIDDLAKGRG